MFQKMTVNGHNVVNKINHHELSNKNINSSDFKSILKNALNEVSKVEHEANVKQQLLIDGKIDDLHNVMITTQKATLTIETAVQIQQKVIDTYNEIMRMQI